LTPIFDEMPWQGDLSTISRISTSVNDDGTISESAGSNFNMATGWMGSAADVADRTGPNGPVRVGVFAGSNTSKQQAGASYYGAMHLADNVHGLSINLTESNGRIYTGLHGDGILNPSGFHNTSGWPSSNLTSQPSASNAGVSVTGSCWMHGSSVAPISRHVAVEPNEEGIPVPENWQRTSFYGGRGVRSAP
jgi:hypothetical protein